MLNITKGIKVGDNTQNQLQFILPINFKKIKTIVNKPKKPIPFDDELELDIILTLLVIVCFISLLR